MSYAKDIESQLSEDMTLEEYVSVLVDGNNESQALLDRLLNNGSDLLGGLQVLSDLRLNQIYGSLIWTMFRDDCRQDVEEFKSHLKYLSYLKREAVD